MMAKISLNQSASLCRRLGSGLKAGVDVRRLLAEEARRGSPAHRANMQRISEQVNRGGTLAEAMRSCDGYFPPLMCDLVEVGEQTGKLERALLQLADHYDHLLQLRRQFLIGITWPMIQLVAAVLIITFLIWFLGVIQPPGQRLVTVFGLAGETGALLFLTLVGLVAALVVFVWMTITRGWLGPLPMLVAMRLPFIGKTLSTTALARMAWTLSMALDAGMDARRSMELALRSTQNPFYRSQARRVDAALLERVEFHEALRRTGAFPEEFISDLAAAELSGTHSESMLRLAEQYQQRAAAASRIITLVLALAVWAVVAAFIVAVIISFFTNVILQPYREALEFLEESM